jgi:hypothetical protein
MWSKFKLFEERKCIKNTNTNLISNECLTFIPKLCSPIYGYHIHDHQYLKVFFYNPGIVRRAANLLQNGAIMGKVYQPHESHVPYILQFFIDFNLYGMSFLNVPKESIVYRTYNALRKYLV